MLLKVHICYPKKSKFCVKAMRCEAPRPISVYRKQILFPMLRSGMLKAVQLCLQLKEDALCTAGVPCHSFVYLNSGTAQRSDARPFGREELPYIDRANCIATRTMLLWLLCTVRYVYFFVEQPTSSRLYTLPYVIHVIKQLQRFMGVYKSFLQLGCKKACSRSDMRLTIR